ncbi:MAG: glycosyltransferase family 39 protein [Silanimonas sp.]
MPDSSARVKFIALWALLLAAKLAFAATMPLFGDEAFYAWEALHPAWAYSDLPGGTAAAVWLGLWLGDALSGGGEFGVRLVFLAAGAAMPWVVVRLACRLGTHTQAWRAGLWSLPIPLLMPMGVMALPDALMTLAALLAVDACAGMLDDDGPRGALYVQFAIALALGALAHYRFAPILLVGAVAFFAVGGWRRRGEVGLWLALAVGAAAWWPVIAYNLDADGAGWRFQLVERHPWAFNAKGLLQPLLQAIITTPLLYALFAWALWRMSRSDASAQVRFVALAGGGLWLLYALLAPFVDKARFSLHWPIPAYLLAATLLPMALDGLRCTAARAWPIRLAPWAAGTAGTATVLMLAAFVVPSSPTLAARTAGTVLYPDNYVGWREIADALRPRLAPGDIVVADHFMLAAQLSFALDRRAEVFVLDHWNNHKHGRAPQIAAWGYDEAALSRIAPGTRAWIAYEVAETPVRDHATWVTRPCRWFAGLEHVATVDGPGGGKRFWLYRGLRREGEAAADEGTCVVALPPG